MRCWNCRRPSGYREQVLKAIGGLAIALANDGKLEEAQQELDTLQKKGASSGDRDLVAAEILSLQKNYDQALALYTKVFNEVEDPQLLSHAYLSAANAALNQDDMEKAVRILKQGCQNLPEGQAVLQKEMLADLMMQQAASDKENAEEYYAEAHQRMAQIRREYLCLPDRSFCGWNRWHDRFGCCGSRFSMDPAQAGKKAEGTDLERVSIKINRLRGMKKC